MGQQFCFSNNDTGTILRGVYLRNKMGNATAGQNQLQTLNILYLRHRSVSPNIDLTLSDTSSQPPAMIYKQKDRWTEMGLFSRSSQPSIVWGLPSPQRILDKGTTCDACFKRIFFAPVGYTSQKVITLSDRFTYCEKYIYIHFLKSWEGGFRQKDRGIWPSQSKTETDWIPITRRYSQQISSSLDNAKGSLLHGFKRFGIFSKVSFAMYNLTIAVSNDRVTSIPQP